MDSNEGFDYQKIVQDALRDAVRRVLAQVAERGLPGEHYFYVGFRTAEPGVEIPRSLREQYPQEMTVILQNQYWGLEVGPDSFSVVLSFNGGRERLTVPFTALTAFVDPSCEFGLRFDGEESAGGPAVDAGKGGGAERRSAPPKRPAAEKRGEVVPFDPTRRR